MAVESALDPTCPAVATRRPLSWIFQTLILANLGLLGFVLWAWLQFGSLSKGLAFAKGDRLFVDAPIKTIGALTPGEAKSVTFEVANLSGVPIIVLGAKSSCTCTTAEKLPLSIPAGARRPFQVAVRAGKQTGPLDASLRLFTDHPSKPLLILKVAGRITGPPPEAHEHKD